MSTCTWNRFISNTCVIMQIQHQVMYEKQLLSTIIFKLKYIPNLENITVKILPFTNCQDCKNC